MTGEVGPKRTSEKQVQPRSMIGYPGVRVDAPKVTTSKTTPCMLSPQKLYSWLQTAVPNLMAHDLQLFKKDTEEKHTQTCAYHILLSTHTLSYRPKCNVWVKKTRSFWPTNRSPLTPIYFHLYIHCCADRCSPSLFFCSHFANNQPRPRKAQVVGEKAEL